MSRLKWRVKLHGGPNPSIAMVGDDLWLAEKFQSNPEWLVLSEITGLASINITAGKTLNELGGEKLLNSIQTQNVDNE